MSKIVDLEVSTSIFEKSISDFYPDGSFLFSEEESCLDEKHSSGSLIIKNNKVISLSPGLESAVKVKKLFMYRSADCLILDGRQISYWARLTLEGNKLSVQDIDVEKRFELDSEDQIEELERMSNKGSSSSFSLHSQ